MRLLRLLFTHPDTNTMRQSISNIICYVGVLLVLSGVLGAGRVFGQKVYFFGSGQYTTGTYFFERSTNSFYLTNGFRIAGCSRITASTSKSTPSSRRVLAQLLSARRAPADHPPAQAVPLAVVFRAMGFESDLEIVQLVGEEDILRYAITLSLEEVTRMEILSQKAVRGRPRPPPFTAAAVQALDYLSRKLMPKSGRAAKGFYRNRTKVRWPALARLTGALSRRARPRRLAAMSWPGRSASPCCAAAPHSRHPPLQVLALCGW